MLIDSTKNRKDDSEEVQNQALILDHENICNQYRIFELYLKLLNPKENRLWQKPNLQNPKKVLHNFDVQVLFTNIPLGKNRAYNCLSNISKYCGTKHYSNHCARATGITLLSNAGYDQNTIAKLSGKFEFTIFIINNNYSHIQYGLFIGHKDTSSLNNYCSTNSMNKKVHMALTMQGGKSKHEAEVTWSKNSSIATEAIPGSSKNSNIIQCEGMLIH